MKKVLNLILGISLIVLMGGADGLATETEHRDGCHVCGMYTDVYHDTAGELQLKSGEKYNSCGVACLLRIVQDEGGPDAFSSIKVRDWTSKQLFDAQNGTYVIGSAVIPDMIPNLIAFQNHADAEAFQAKEGGEIIDFGQALNSISPMGMTMPTRISSAVLPPKGAFGIGVGYMSMKMDEVKMGSSSVDPNEFVRRPGQTMSPSEMESKGEMLMLNYGIMDNLALSVKTSYLEKKMHMLMNMMGNVTESTSKNTGITDTSLSLRYNVWRNTYYSKFFSLMAGTTLPTGDFDEEWRNSPGMQLGTGDFTFTGGVLYSQRVKDFWFHGLASYTTKLENSDDYKFGDEARIGAALHYTPNYNLMLGLELDGVHTEKDENRNVDVGNTGGFRSNLSAIIDWKFLTALGGNFSLRTSAGVPIYEDMNHYTTMGMEKVQLGEGYFFNVAINFKRRFATN